MSKKKKNKPVYSSQHQPPQINQLKELYLQAQQLQQQGYLSKAEMLYREILDQIPDQPDALHYLGLIHMHKGEDKLAEKYIRQSIQSSGNPIYFSNYGLLLSRLGKYEQAVVQYKKAVELQPAYAEAWFNLGAILPQLGDLPAAEDAYKKAITCRKDYIKAMYGLASVQEAQGKSDEAETTVGKIQAIVPDSAQTYLTLGITLQFMGGSRNIHKAYEYLNKAIELDPESVEIYYALAKLLEEGNEIDAALEVYQKILSIEPDYQDVKIHYARCLLKNNQVSDAEKEVSKILKNNPDNFNAQVILGNIYRIKGNFSEAETIYEKILKVDKYFNSALVGLASCRKFTDKNDDYIKVLYEAVTRRKSALTYNALGKIHNDLGEFDLAFDAYDKANDIKNRKADFDPEKHTAYVDAIISIFTKEFIERLQPHGNPSELPVFIIGTPRSGTTLTEQIISSHPKVKGAGELKYIDVLAKNKEHRLITDKKYPERIAYLMPEDIQNESGIYLNKIQNYKEQDNILRITDKMPGNFFYLGYILILFPRARIIHCRRNPLDSCLSMYFQFFQEGHQYSFNLANLGHWYKDYVRLMQHWSKIFGDHILDVDYDMTVNDTETTARTLIKFCGLEWDEKCLEFHKQDRQIHTASQWQVRQPIYKTSLERWKRYDKHIGVLKKILAGLY